MKIRSFEIGVESFTRAEPGEGAHLPREGALSPTFLPKPGHLDAVLRRPSLDERLPQLLEPRNLDAALLEPATLSATRRAAGAHMAEAARRALGQRRRILEEAALILGEDAELDDEVRAALAALLKA